MEAGGDLSASQYCFVQLATDSQVDAVASAGGDAIGILQNDPAAAGRAATVGIAGISQLKLGGNVTAGDKVQSHTDGTGLLAATADHVLARAIDGGVAGDIVRVLLVNHHILA